MSALFLKIQISSLDYDAETGGGSSSVNKGVEGWFSGVIDCVQSTEGVCRYFGRETHRVSTNTDFYWSYFLFYSPAFIQSASNCRDAIARGKSKARLTGRARVV